MKKSPKQHLKGTALFLSIALLLGACNLTKGEQDEAQQDTKTQTSSPQNETALLSSADQEPSPPYHIKTSWEKEGLKGPVAVCTEQHFIAQKTPTGEYTLEAPANGSTLWEKHFHPDGTLFKELSIQEDQSITLRIDYTYDKQLRRIEKRLNHYLPRRSWSERYIYSYDENNLLVQILFYYDGDTIDSKEELFYDEKGHLSSMKKYPPSSPDRFDLHTYKTDKDGRILIEETFLSLHDRELSNRTTTFYDSRGLKTDDFIDDLIRERRLEYHYRYTDFDEHGNWTRQWEFDKDKDGNETVNSVLVREIDYHDLDLAF